MKLKCLVVDDEPRAHVVLKNYIEKVADLEIVHSTTSSVEAFSYLQNNPVDLLFLDIEMPELTGLELLEALQKPPKVIITSAHSEFAVDSYNFNVTDYLLKPIPFNRFLKSVNKVLHQYSPPNASEEPENTSPNQDHFFVKEDGISKRIDYASLLYVNSFGNYVRIYTTEGKHMIADTMKHMEETLPSDRFLRIHKSYIINLSKVDQAHGKMVTINEQELPVGNAYRQQLLERLGN
ncbi:MAG: LytTR family DNA-binding domain-containing protein [Bacteroidota bacterium]